MKKNVQLMMLFTFFAIASFSSCKKDNGHEGPCVPSPPCPTCDGALTAVTWDGITYFNDPPPDTGYPWTTYKSTPTEDCTGGGKTGRIYKWNSSTCAWDFYGIGDCTDNDVYFASGTP